MPLRIFEFEPAFALCEMVVQHILKAASRSIFRRRLGSLIIAPASLTRFFAPDSRSEHSWHLPP